jgi:predicted RNA-binding protein with PIN domain
MKLPAAVSAALARGIAAYLRDAPPTDIPSSLRAISKFRDQALTKHRAKLIDSLDNDDFRAKVGEWLEDGANLKKDDARLLSVAVARGEGWEKELSNNEAPKRPAKNEAARLKEALDKERARTAKLKEESRSAREAARAEVQAAKRRTAEATEEIRELRARLRSSESEMKAARVELDKTKTSIEKDRRALRREAERATAAKKEAAERLASSKREVAALKREKNALDGQLADARAALERTKKVRSGGSQKAGPRRPLKAPKGLLDDAPETLLHWLATDEVRLIVDGYNVGKAKKGFNVDLEPMRKRLVDEVAKLARRFKLDTTVIFDGADVAPGTPKLRRPPVRIVYSPPDVIADDIIVDTVRESPPHPIIVVTNDKGLQGRVAKLGATVATSDQLLTMVRSRKLS